MNNSKYHAHIILSVIGPDKPGIVSGISAIVKNHFGNIEHSRMIRLGEYFTIMVLVSINNNNIQNLKNELNSNPSLQISINELTNKKTNISDALYKIFLKGIDNEGIVYKITKELADLDINIEELETKTENAPMSGLNLFSLTAIITHPNLDYDALKKKMDLLALELDVNIVIET